MIDYRGLDSKSHQRNPNHAAADKTQNATSLQPTNSDSVSHTPPSITPTSALKSTT